MTSMKFSWMKPRNKDVSFDSFLPVNQDVHMVVNMVYLIETLHYQRKIMIDSSA